MDSIYTKRNKKEKKKIGRKVLFFLVVALIFVGGFKGCKYTIRSIRGLNCIKIKEIKVKAPSNIDPQEIINLSGIKKGDSVLGSIDEAKKRISTYKWVKNVRIRRSLPSTLTIEITPKQVKALALIQGTVYYVDEEGKLIDIFVPGYQADYPVINSMPENYPRILSIMDQLRKLEPLSELSLEQDVLTVYSSKFTIKIKFDMNGIEKEIPKAFKVIDDLKEKGETASAIDASLPGNRVVVIGLRKN